MRHFNYRATELFCGFFAVQDNSNFKVLRWIFYWKGYWVVLFFHSWVHLFRDGTTRRSSLWKFLNLFLIRFASGFSRKEEVAVIPPNVKFSPFSLLQSLAAFATKLVPNLAWKPTMPTKPWWGWSWPSPLMRRIQQDIKRWRCRGPVEEVPRHDWELESLRKRWA